MNELEQRVIAILDRACKAFNYAYEANSAVGNMLTAHLAPISHPGAAQYGIMTARFSGERADVSIDFGAQPPKVHVRNPVISKEFVTVLERELNALGALSAKPQSGQSQAATPTSDAKVAESEQSSQMPKGETPTPAAGRDTLIAETGGRGADARYDDAANKLKEGVPGVKYTSEAWAWFRRTYSRPDDAIFDDKSGRDAFIAAMKRRGIKLSQMPKGRDKSAT